MRRSVARDVSTDRQRDVGDEVWGSTGALRGWSSVRCNDGQCSTAPIHCGGEPSWGSGSARCRNSVRWDNGQCSIAPSIVEVSGARASSYATTSCVVATQLWHIMRWSVATTHRNALMRLHPKRGKGGALRCRSPSVATTDCVLPLLCGGVCEVVRRRTVAYNALIRCDDAAQHY